MSENPTRARSRPRSRKATGPDRPKYFDTNDIDRVMGVLLALVSEVAAIRERLDTHERLADEGQMPSGVAVENYGASTSAETDREVWRDSYIKRLFRVITEDIEGLGADSAATDVAD